MAYEDLSAKDMVVVDVDGHIVDGSLNLSSDTKTHIEFFKAFGEIGAIPCTRNLTYRTFQNRSLNSLFVSRVLCRSHGPFAWGKDAAQVVYHAVEMCIRDRFRCVFTLKGNENSRISRIQEEAVDCGMDFLWVGQQNREPVSYTHLDVYKRQVVRGQIPYLNEHIAQKKAIYERYRAGFKGLPVQMNPIEYENSEPNYWLSCLIIDPDAMCKPVSYTHLAGS